jgi:hypothetical protein
VILSVDSKLLEAAMALLQATPSGELNIVLLNKALFYLDLVCLLEDGETATSTRYMAYKLGPVVSDYQHKLVEPLESNALALQVTVGQAKPLRVASPLSKFCCLTPRQQEHAKNVARKIAKFTSGEASALSHRNPGWIIARKQAAELRRDAWPIDLDLAMQELADDFWENDLDAEIATAIDTPTSQSDSAWR